MPWRMLAPGVDEYPYQPLAIVISAITSVAAYRVRSGIEGQFEVSVFEFLKSSPE
jgi:hypothetical protein